jgi:hypothetical protein
MSFKELAEAAVARRKKEVKIKLKEGKELLFFANEISFLQRVELGILTGGKASGDEVHTNLVAMSITDEDGKHMTPEQAAALSSEHQEVFYRAALDVNSLEGKAKKKAE